VTEPVADVVPEPVEQPAPEPVEQPAPEPVAQPDLPEPLAPAPEEQPVEPGFRQRGRMRRRARYLRRLREVQLRDIGGFVLELHRFARERPELVQAKVTGAASTDVELRALERALGGHHTLLELREAGIGGACGRCRAVHGSGDRFCASCGEPLVTRARSADEPPAPG
jgi:hypothetical protein